MSGDHSDVPYLQAKRYATGRPDGPPLWIVWHTTENDELPDMAERVAQYFHTLPDGRVVSSHYVHDADSSVQCVRLADTAFTAGNRAGNYRGVNVELVGRAAQTAAQWADSYSRAMLRRACTIAARDMARYGIPNRWCTVDDLLARRAGHTTHNDLRIAFGGTHTDPGPAFPRGQVLDLIAIGGEEIEMTPEESRQLFNIDRLLTALLLDTDEVTGLREFPGDPTPVTYPLRLAQRARRIAEIEAKVDSLLARGPVDAAAVASALARDVAFRQALIDALAAQLQPATPEQVAEAVADELHERTAG